MQAERGSIDELAEALRTEQRWRTAGSTPPPDWRNVAGHPDACRDQHPANSRPRAPSQPTHRRNSFDERRIPPTLMEDGSVLHSVDGAPSPMQSTRSGGRPRSGTTSSHKLLRRISTDTVNTVDFDSEPETFNPGRPASIASTCTRRSSLIGGIHIRDNSNQEIASFAREVRLPAFHTVGNSFGGFVAYECQIITREGQTLRAMKRYSAFCKLRDELAMAYPRFSHLVDTLPPKSLAKFRVSFLEKRRKRLAFWLSTVLLHPVLGASQQARTWILES